MRHLLTGILTSALVLINTLVCMIPLMVFALLKLLIPIAGFKVFCFEAVRSIAATWISLNILIFRYLTPTYWDIRGQQVLNRQESLLVISNHQTWVDIPALMVAIHGKAPFFTFFLKRELIWVPLLGLAWWALEYPFMRRHSKTQLEKNPQLRGQDLDITRKACDRLNGRPVSLVNYLEGTRFTSAKHQQQQSPYQYLLKPKSGGVAFTLNAMNNQLVHYLDITLVYFDEQPPTFWNLLSGKVKRVIIDIQKQPIPKAMMKGDYQQDPVFRANFQAWINQLWQAKDQRITRLRQDFM
ncbi:MAG TPA: acyltransferase [Marinospirillum sp.]|uniref:acyltransferase n=1 Tax=Marinospirillum sp. TaxID=2183934 RepID=UPI002B4A30DA|nr:acyltransferase [Marinospirillum sp.]HKM16227.1 acyltransferase [Marinospirillum sp.]